MARFVSDAAKTHNFIYNYAYNKGMEIIFMLTVMVIIGLLCAGMFAYGVPPTPTLPHVKRAALSLMPANPTHIAELGSGWGGVTRAIARKYPTAQITAYELSYLPYLFSKLTAPKGVSVLRADFMKADLSKYDMLYAYLTPTHMQALKPHVKSGSVIVSAAFAIDGWTPDAQVKTGITPIYRYTAP